MKSSSPFSLVMPLALAAASLSTAPAAAQWTRVTGVRAAFVYSLAQHADTVLASTDDTVYVSLDGGVSWRASAVGTTSTPITAVWVQRGLLWAGIRGNGARMSADAGVSWQNVNAGLSGGSALFVSSFQSRGDSLYAGTEGAGTYVKRLSTLGPWSLFGPNIVNSASGTVTALQGEAQRLMVNASPNGIVAYNDRGNPAWTEVALEPLGGGAGLEMTSFAWTGSSWLTAGGGRIYRSATGTVDWTQVGPPVGCCLYSKLASKDGLTVASFSQANGGAALFYSSDGGVTWTFLESLPAVAIDLMMRGPFLYAGRVDGLWRRSLESLDVQPPSPSSGVEFALAGPNPVRDGATALRFALSAAGRVRITAVDVAGRLVDTLADGEFPAGLQRLTWDASRLQPGVYSVRFETPGVRRSLRVVLLRK
jgi:hypothetical protein